MAGLVVGGNGSGDGRERNACGGRISISGGLGQFTGGGSVVQAHTLGRKTSDCTVRPGSWANNSARAGGMNLIVTTGSGSVACTVTSSRGAM